MVCFELAKISIFVELAVKPFIGAAALCFGLVPAAVKNLVESNGTARKPGFRGGGGGGGSGCCVAHAPANGVAVFKVDCAALPILADALADAVAVFRVAGSTVCFRPRGCARARGAEPCRDARQVFIAGGTVCQRAALQAHAIDARAILVAHVS